MTSTANQQEDLRSLRNALPAAPEGLREAALAEFQRLGLPTVRLEDWRYTSLREIADGEFTAAGDDANVDATSTAQLRDFVAGRSGLAFVNGRHCAELLAADLAGSAQLQSLAAALKVSPDEVATGIAAVDDIERSSLVTLNTAHLGCGAIIRIPDGVVVESPIHLFYATVPTARPRAFHVRNLIHLGKHSRVTVVEHYLGLGNAPTWTNSATDIVLADGAKLSHYKLQQESAQAYHTADIAALQGANSSWHSISLSLGARLCRNDIRSRLTGSGADCSLDGLYLAGAEQHVDTHTTIDHAAPHCTSVELYKGILGGRAVGVFNGKVLVRNQAQRTDARQLNKNLLLSDAATINTKPQLEIFADDVKCSHGATTGRLDEDAIFFLRARGLDEEAARNLLTYAFANEIVERIADDGVRQPFEAIVRDHLDAIFAAEGSR